MTYKITLNSNNGQIDYRDGLVSLTAERADDDTRASMTITFSDWERDAYVFMPACVYDSNAFKKQKCSYPPMYQESFCGVNAEPVISDVPALEPDRSGKIEVTSADMSVPCVALFYKEAKKAFFLFTEQAFKDKNIGFKFESGELTVQFPAIRQGRYRLCRKWEIADDSGISVEKSESVCAKIQIMEYDCADLSKFFELFFQNRRCLLSDAPAENGYTKELWDIMEEHLNRDNFSGEYYAEISKTWQAGWVGGGMSSLPLLKHGTELSKKRAVSTIDFMTTNVAPTGFFYTFIKDGKISDDGFGHEHMKNCALTRKLGDSLYFLFKHFDVITPKKSWVSAAKKCADAFVRLYEKYSDFGQFINIESGEMMFGGTTSGASAIGALVRAWQYFDEPAYLETARLAGKKYYNDFVARGLTYGGPCEAMCAPDSESSFAMVESLVLLYEATKDEKWLDCAKDALHLFSSWVMPYSFAFPKDSMFGKFGINTVGSVFANVQNKHSAPGICTASGDAIYKIYKYTENKAYLDLLRDIAFFIPQCVSTEQRPMLSWDIPPRELPSGWICERVNTSDWETPRNVGAVFFASCWCETSLLLSFSELIWNDEIAKLL